MINDFSCVFDLTAFGQAEAAHTIIEPAELELLYHEALGEPLDVVQAFNNHSIT